MRYPLTSNFNSPLTPREQFSKMHVNSLLSVTDTNNIIIQPTANNPLLVKPVAIWRQREVSLPDQPTEQKIHYSQALNPPPQTVFYPVPLPVAAPPLPTVSAQSDTYPIAVVSTRRRIPAFIPAQEQALYFCRPTFCAPPPPFSPFQASLTPCYIPQPACSDTAMQFLPRFPAGSAGIAPAKASEAPEVMELITLNRGRYFTSTIDDVAYHQRAGTGNIQLGSFNLKVGLRFPLDLMAHDMISSSIQGKLCFSSWQALTQYLSRQPAGCFYTKDQQREPISRIPIFLKCDEMKSSSSTQLAISQDSIAPLEAEQEIPKILDHLKSLNEKRVNARIVFFDSKQIGGIACHRDPTTGYLAYFMFNTPTVYTSLSVSSLRGLFCELEATIQHSMNDSELSDYIESLGVGSFIRRGIRRRGSIQLFSHTVSFVSDD